LSGGTWLPEEDYEVKGDQINGPTEAPRKGRLSPNSLFKNMAFYIDPNMNSRGPSKEDLISLVNSGGGTLLSKKAANSNYMIIKEERDKKSLLDMISRFEAKLV
jgi:hypothetical protein